MKKNLALGAVHGDRPGVCEDAALGSTADGRQGVALPQNSEETRQGGVFVVRSPMGGIGEPSSLRDEDLEGSTADRAKSLKDMFSSAVARRASLAFRRRYDALSVEPPDIDGWRRRRHLSGPAQPT